MQRPPRPSPCPPPHPPRHRTRPRGGNVGCRAGGVGGRQGGWRRGEAAVALETTGDLRRQPPPLGAVVRLLILRAVAEQQQRQSGQLPPAPNRPATINRHGLVDLCSVHVRTRAFKAKMEYSGSSFHFLSLQRLQHKELLTPRGAAPGAGPYAMQGVLYATLLQKIKNPKTFQKLNKKAPF